MELIIGHYYYVTHTEHLEFQERKIVQYIGPYKPNFYPGITHPDPESLIVVWLDGERRICNPLLYEMTELTDGERVAFLLEY